MAQIESEINLHDKVEDKITGYTGTVTSISFHVDGTSQACVERVNPVDMSLQREWLDVGRLR